MKKRDKAIKDICDITELESIIKKCSVCHVGMVDGDSPYVLGFNFGYENKIIYLHSTTEGKKLDILRKNPKVCVNFDTDFEVFARNEDVACSWRQRYRSVLCFGKVEFVENYDEKIEALKIFMRQYSSLEFKFSEPAVNNICILKIPVEEMTGRSFEY